MFRAKTYNLCRTRETDSWRAKKKKKKKILYLPGTRRKDQWPHKRLTQTHLWVSRPEVSSIGVGWQRPTSVSGALSASVPAWGLLKEVPLSSLPPPKFGLRSNNREGTQTHLSSENLIKDFLSMAHPSEQDLVFPRVSLSQQEASIRLLSYASENRQNENHNHKKLSKLITWITALSNSMKLWATQDRWVMVESSDKMWSIGERNGRLLQ